MTDLTAILTCPHCGHGSVETMPVHGCVAFHECEGCHVVVTPKAGDCCVFCSYADQRCPSVRDGTPCAGPLPFTPRRRIG
jgi:hypothetical protein